MIDFFIELWQKSLNVNVFSFINHFKPKYQAVKMKLLICVFFLISFARSEISERSCVENYYENKNIGVRADADFCQILFQNFTTEFTDDIKDRVKIGNNRKCILDTFNQYNITGLYLRGLIKHLYNNRPENDAYEDDVDESKDVVIRAATVLCTADKKYGNDFDKNFRSFNNESEDSHSEKCMKKYFIDKKIIDPTQYNIDPPAIDEMSCGTVNENLDRSLQIADADDVQKNTFFGLSAMNAQRCTKEKFRDEKVLENIYSLQIIEKLNLSQQQIEMLRLNYIKLMTASVKFLLDCMREI